MGDGRNTILLVDPDPNGSRQVGESLESLDAQLVVFDNPSEAMKAAEIQPPDLALVEQQLGKANGLELTARLVLGPGCPVVVLAGEDSIVRHFMAIQVGAWDYLPKPLEMDWLTAAVKDCLDRSDRGEKPRPVLGPGVQPLDDLLEEVEREALTGVLNLERPGKVARMLFSFGDVQTAEYGHLRGLEAVNAMARHGDWSSTFKEESDDTDADAARRARVAWEEARTRHAFYGPPTLAPAENDIDPHELATRRVELPPEEVAGTVVDRHPPIINQSTRELLASLDDETTMPFDQSQHSLKDSPTREFADEATTQRSRREVDPAYDDMQVVYREIEDPDIDPSSEK